MYEGGSKNTGGGGFRYGVNGERRPAAQVKTPAGSARAASAMGNTSSAKPQRHGQLRPAIGTLREEQARAEAGVNPHGPTMESNIGKGGTVNQSRIGGGGDLRKTLSSKGYASGAQDVARFQDDKQGCGLKGYKLYNKNATPIGLG